MGMYFGLQIECGSEVSARAVAAYFKDLPLVLSDGPTVRCEASTWRDAEGNWWASALPAGASATRIPGKDVQELTSASRLTQFGEILYERLRTAPAFRYALVGIETSEFRYFSELDQDLVELDFPGLVVAAAIWNRLGQPAVFEEFSPGYFWRPYKGEAQGLTAGLPKASG